MNIPPVASRRQWDAFARDHVDAPWVALLKDGLHSRWAWKWAGKKLFATDAANAAAAFRSAHPNRLALVAPSIEAALIKHAAPPGLLEPEEIGHSFSKRQAIITLLPLFWIGNTVFPRLAAGMPLGVAEVLWLVAWCGFALFALAWFASALGERFALMKTTRGIVRAGPGWVDDRAGRRWTIEDSVLIVREMAPSKKPHYQAMLLGPQGLMPIPIGRGDGLAFIDLWQRWTTPIARLDLIPPSVAPRELRLISRLWRGKWVDPNATDSSRPTGV